MPITVAKATTPPSQISRAVMWMLIGGMSFVLLSGGVKVVSKDLHIAVIVFFRSAAALLILAPVVLWRGIERLSTKRFPTHFLRAVVGTLSLFCFVFALQNLSLVNAVSISFSTPLWAVIFAMLLLKETVGWRRRIATAVGFVGILIILRPSGELHPAMLVALAGALFSAAVMILVKTLTSTEHPLVMTAYFSMFGSVFSIAPAIAFWTTPSAIQIAILLGISVLGIIGIYSVARAFALADAVIVAPIDFCRLPLAAALGLIVFGEVPDVTAFMGTAVVLIAVYYITRRERELSVDAPRDGHT